MTRTHLALVGFALLALISAGCNEQTGSPEAMQHQLVDSRGPREPWGKAVGDINGDGRPDLIVAGNGPELPVLWRRVLDKLGVYQYVWPDQGILVWYESPDWKKHVVSNQYRFRTDLEVADIDGDGKSDIVAVTDQGLVWFHNPDWKPHRISDLLLHDVEVADLDGDGKIDIVARNQSLFGHNNGDQLYFFKQVSPTHWEHSQLTISHGEGLKVADLDGDGWPDVVVNQAWYRNPGSTADLANWQKVPYCPSWHWPHTYLNVRDINQDGKPDIILSPAEPVGSFFRLSWCESPFQAGDKWVEHVVDPRVETAMHSVVLGDFNNDGRVDIAAATMHQALGPKDIAIYWQADGGGSWSRSVIGTTGSHSMKALDFDLDGDLDIFGANWTGDHQPVELWKNTNTIRTSQNWRRHVIDSDMPWRSVFVHTADIDGDGLKDIVAGGWWYKNPGTLSEYWSRREIGMPANNVALVADFNGDGTPDLLSSTWNDLGWTLYERFLVKLGFRGRFEAGGLVWAQNDGHGNFQIHSDIASGKGDFLQGVALLQEPLGKRVILSWHEPGRGLQQVRVPNNLATQIWRTGVFADDSQDEALSVADIDKDGLNDVITGTRWLRNNGDGSWSSHILHHTSANPDRHSVADLDGDGRLDVVIGYEAVSALGNLAWYRQESDPFKPWTEHAIAELTGPMSLDLADMDGDGDLDVVVGEHDLKHPEMARLVWFENLSGDGSRWAMHVIHTGDEHHDGAHVVDIDNDGDLDVVSIGWGHRKLILYENLRTKKR